ncbi:putative benzoate 4-monooxygenase cytochrome P450 [Pseudomassariella vexata]|uniref:Putative benzoate 4-monooxygenase cytochrome P450 n=1 Tax=Pseudomassariella vexata TaxID=1141098 RepID=A0A1Y2E031_9PEZI|nr:putative benzoate 4-monooxygenase cytochrome P450 [Pseudomassariella vexata]ORY64225.1 putative benzoate 4-monooxygenase cytochrome P450 [Pseudomassariella vexata]
MAARLVLSLEGLRTFLDTDVSRTVVIAINLGFLFHVTILRNVEVENFMYQLLEVLSLATGGLVFAYHIVGFSIVGALTRVAIIVFSFNSGLFLSIVIYRLFFHRLHKFPGPKGAKISRFYSAIIAAKEVKYFKEVDRMHEKYGDFIRTGPRELCIVRKSAVPLIYGPNSECLKSTWYMQVDSNYKKCSIHMTRDFDNHKSRRRAWDRGFSIRALNTYEPRIKAKVDQFVTQLSKSKGPLDGTAWSMYLAFDVMGEVGFSKDFGSVASGTEHPAIKGVHEHMNILGIMSHVPWLLNLLSCIPFATAGYTGFFGWCASEIKTKQKDYDPNQYPQDIITWLLKSFLEKDASASSSAEALHEDSRVVIIAGSETTATTLAAILYYLALQPAVLAKLQSQVDALMPIPSSWTYEKMKSITYIDDIINETLRLKPALLTGGYRVTPPQGIQVDEQFIPGDTNVFVPVQQIHTDKRYWKQANEFVPERFGERREEMGTEGAPFVPFSLGAYSCPGKNLAMISLRIAISRLAQQLDISFAPGETGETFDKEAKDTFTTTLPPVMLRFTQR